MVGRKVSFLEWDWMGKRVRKAKLSASSVYQKLFSEIEEDISILKAVFQDLF